MYKVVYSEAYKMIHQKLGSGSAAMPQENLSSGVSDQVRSIPACSATETS